MSSYQNKADATSVVLVKRRRGFTQVDNELIDDPSVSAKAKGVYLFLERKPDGWLFTEAEIVSHMADGITAIRSALQELIKTGWIARVQLRKNGRFVGSQIIIYQSKAEQPLQQLDEGKPEADEPNQESQFRKTEAGLPGHEVFQNRKPHNNNTGINNTNPPPKSPPTGGKDGPGGPGGGGYESLDQDDPISRPCPQQRGRQSEAVRQHIHTRTKGRSRAWANPKAVDAWLDAGVPGDTIIRVVLKAEEGLDIHSWRFFERRVMAAESSYEDCENGGVIDDIRDKAHSSVVPLVEKALEMDDVQLAMDLAKAKLVDGLLTFQGQYPAMLKYFAQNRVPRFRAIAQAVGIELNPRVFA